MSHSAFHPGILQPPKSLFKNLYALKFTLCLSFTFIVRVAFGEPSFLQGSSSGILTWAGPGLYIHCPSAHSHHSVRRNTQGKAAFSIHSLVRGLAFTWVYKSIGSILSFQLGNIFIFYILFVLIRRAVKYT